VQLAAKKFINCRGLDGHHLKLIIDMNQEQQCFKMQTVLDIVYMIQDVEQPTHLLMEHVETEESLLLQKNMFVVYIKLDRTQLAHWLVMPFNML
jgi:hypothetical protein